MTFSSGFEWGYWQNDYATTRMNYQLADDWNLGPLLAATLDGHDNERVSLIQLGDRLADQIENHGWDAPATAAALADAAVPESLDGLVYCPGSINLKPFRGLKDQHYRDDFEINVVGAARALRHFLPALKKGQFPGVVLFFDGSWNLVAKDEGFLSDLLLRPQLPRFLGADAGGEGDA